MKFKVGTVLIILAGFLAAGTIAWAVSSDTAPSTVDRNVTLKVFPEKKTYSLGEIVRARFNVSNDNESPISLPYRPTVLSGYLEVWIAYHNQQFQRYKNSSWGRLEGSGVTIPSGGAFVSDATVFWNNKPHVSTEDRAILTDYAFPKVGSYKIKAVLSIPDEESPDVMRKIESEPVELTFTEPVADDLIVWNLIKDSGDVAYFIQQEETPSYRDKKAQDLTHKLERIVQDYPNSSLAGQIKASLEKFRADELRRVERLEKAKIKGEK